MPRILIVEDDPRQRKYLDVFWRKDGYCPEWASSAEEAKILIQKNLYNYIISDVTMPIETGSDLAKWVKDNYPEIPIFLTSAVPEIQTNAAIYENHYCDRFIEKPLYPYKFEEAIGFKRGAA